MGIELAVDLAKLTAAELRIQQALAIYRQAVAKAKAAAAALLADWEGDAAEAFRAEQENAYRWHACIIEVVESFIDELIRTIQKYEDALQKIKDAITNH